MLMQRHRKMGVDYGDKRIGIAFSDPMCIISSPFEVYQNKGEEDALNHLCKLVNEYSVDEIAFGLPLNMDGTEGERALIHRDFGEKLEKLSGAKVYFIDERLTSAEAEDMLIASGVRREKRKELIDKISAQIILQTYISSKKGE
jgi:putative Holliday junction resolvase